ncbi:hypothetical protein [Blastopirellula retiformator]|uniref:Uncharacterized protein n=1 Tax=Blastopirellula retiformator TaxID=2527970 RepID=A0A5C5VKK5_9BACT|nr:hypothetical protein [Blastopirellula retiformator]TWT38497.1 hypothetical protein Enr8_01890 [Blastopirellula retiformator]
MSAPVCLLLSLVAAPADESTLKLLQQFRGEFVAITPADSAKQSYAIC